MRRILIALLLVAGAALAGPRFGPRTSLFNGRNLEGFHTFLRNHGRDNDPDHVFTVERGLIHVSGKEFGYLITDKQYENYYLHVEFKWGERNWPPREGLTRDSGVLFHVNGEDKIFPHSIEFQMIEGGTGDIILVDNVDLTVKGETKHTGRFDRFGKGPWKDVTGYRDPEHELERTHGKWNCLELWAIGDTVRYKVNGKLANEGSHSSLTRGRILLQSEGAEVWFRKVELRQLLSK